MPTGGRAEETQDPTQLEKGNSSSRSTAQPTLRLRRGICPCTASLGRPSRPPAALRAGPPPARGKAGVGVVEEALPLVLQSGERENWAWGDQTHRSAYPAVCAPPCPVPPASAFEHWERRGWGQPRLDQSVFPLVWWTVLSQPGPAQVLKGTREVKERANEIVSSAGRAGLGSLKLAVKQKDTRFEDASVYVWEVWGECWGSGPCSHGHLQGWRQPSPSDW